MFSSHFMDRVENRFKKFMYCSVYGLKKDYLCKQRKRTDSEVFQDDSFVHLKEDFRCDLDILNEICNKQLYDTIIALTDKQRSILFMLIIDQYSESEAASRLNISQQRVNKVKSKVLTILRESLEEE